MLHTTSIICWLDFFIFSAWAFITEYCFLKSWFCSCTFSSIWFLCSYRETLFSTRLRTTSLSKGLRIMSAAPNPMHFLSVSIDCSAVTTSVGIWSIHPFLRMASNTFPPSSPDRCQSNSTTAMLSASFSNICKAAFVSAASNA